MPRDNQRFFYSDPVTFSEASAARPAPVKQTVQFVTYLPADKVALATAAKDKQVILKIDQAMQDGDTEKAFQHVRDLSPQLQASYRGVVATRKDARHYAEQQGHMASTTGENKK